MSGFDWSLLDLLAAFGMALVYAPYSRAFEFFHDQAVLASLIHILCLGVAFGESEEVGMAEHLKDAFG